MNVQKWMARLTFILSILFFLMSFIEKEIIYYRLWIGLSLLSCLLAFRFYSKTVEKGNLNNARGGEY